MQDLRPAIRAAQGSSPQELTDVADLFGMSKDKLENGLTIKTTEIGGKILESAFSAEDAAGVARTLGKEVYATVRVFY